MRWVGVRGQVARTTRRAVEAAEDVAHAAADDPNRWAVVACGILDREDENAMVAVVGHVELGAVNRDAPA